MSPLAVRDAMRLAESVYSGNLWRRQLAGEQIFNSAYDPVERINHYNARNERYAKYLAKHITKGTIWDDILNVITSVLEFLPEEIKKQVLNYIISTIKEWIFGKDSK